MRRWQKTMIGNPDRPEPSTPKGVSGKELLSWLPADWKVISSHGQVELAPSYNGYPLVSYLKREGSDADAYAAAKRVLDYLSGLNKETAEIAATTRITSHPLLMMAPPEKWGVLNLVGWQLLKARLEASGAKVILSGDGSSTNSFENWTRDRYVIAPDGTLYFHRTLKEEDRAQLGWDKVSEPSAPINARYKTWFQNYDNRIAKVAAASEALKTFVKAQGKSAVQLEGFTEGGNVLQHPASHSVFIGVSANSEGQMSPVELKDAQELAAHLGMRLIAVPRIKNIPFYHLDTFMSVLPDGSIILFPDATTPAVTAQIRALVPPEKFLEVPGDGASAKTVDRRLLATNFVTVNGNLFAASTTPEIREFVHSRGFRLYVGPHEFGESGPHCQVNFLLRDMGDGRSDVAVNTPPESAPFTPRPGHASTRIRQG